MKRSRGRNRRSGGNPQSAFNNPNRHFESVGPDVKIRGSAQQVLEKYLQYARDAQTSGDRILSEAYFQFAEHYQRIVAKQQEARSQQQQPQQNRGDRRDDQGGRGQGERDNRGGPSGEGAESGDGEGEEAVVVTTSRPREPEEGESSDSLRVIDSDDEGEASAEAEENAEAGETARTERAGSGRQRRKPYKAREERGARKKEEADAGSDAPEIEGVMKTLSRGRRRPAVEEDAEAEATD